VIRAIRVAWLAFRGAWRYRHCDKIVVDLIGVRNITRTQALDLEWRALQGVEVRHD